MGNATRQQLCLFVSCQGIAQLFTFVAYKILSSHFSRRRIEREKKEKEKRETEREKARVVTYANKKMERDYFPQTLLPLPLSLSLFTGSHSHAPIVDHNPSAGSRSK
jgi:hypothetical protein